MRNTSTTVCNLLSWQLNQVRNCLFGLSNYCYNSPDEINTPDNLIAVTDSFSVQIFTSIRQVPKDWDELAPQDNLFLQRPYLSMLEMYPPENMQFCYFLFYEHHQAVGIAIGQLLPFQAAESLKEQAPLKEDETCGLPTVERRTKILLAKRIQFSVLTIGNLLLTGEHGFAFRQGITRQQQFILLSKAATRAQHILTQKGWKINVLSLKDFFEENRPSASTIQQFQFNECSIQPNMIMPLAKTWHTFDDYLAALSSKYRVRAKRAFKKAASIERRVLDESAIEQHIETIYQLYKNVAQNADFNVLTLHPHYFLALQQSLGKAFQLTGYFKDGKLIGFCTTIKNGAELEAHFLGFEERENQEHQLYLNMLYDIIAYGIEQQAERIVFARTAPEIKTSVGAQAHEMYCYLRHRQPMMNHLLRPLLNYLEPKVVWQARHPFKEASY